MWEFPHFLIDVELTNRCNALCFFCPRDKTPQQGMITRANFEKAIERAAALKQKPHLSLTGQGEPTLHPDIASFIQYAKQQGFYVSTTSNGSLLSEELALALINSGLDKIHFSISDLDSTYEQVYNLDFEKVVSNVERFIRLNQGRVDMVVNIVKHELNSHRLKEIKKFWQDRGIKRFLEFNQINRGGACDNGHEFVGNRQFVAEAERIMADNGISSLCPSAFLYLFVGWNGNYYICCNDYQKLTPLGHVTEMSLEDLNEKKLQELSAGIKACLDCNLDPTNKIREKLYEIERGVTDTAQLDKTIAEMRAVQEKLPAQFNDVNWRQHYAQASGIIAKA